MNTILTKNKDEIFCFAYLRWCHNGWASNILIVVDTDYVPEHRLLCDASVLKWNIAPKYLMPIHYDTIEDGQNKKAHLLFS